METIFLRPDVQVLALVLVIESLNVLTLGTVTAFLRGKTGKFVNPEDVTWLGGELVTLDGKEAARVKRAHANALENLLPFSILALMFILAEVNTLAGIGYFVIFSAARLAHTFSYLTGRARMRRNAYSTAWLVQIVLALHLAIVLLWG